MSNSIEDNNDFSIENQIIQAEEAGDEETVDFLKRLKETNPSNETTTSDTYSKTYVEKPFNPTSTTTTKQSIGPSLYLKPDGHVADLRENKRQKIRTGGKRKTKKSKKTRNLKKSNRKSKKTRNPKK
jgi:hypothetical protein